MARKNGNQDYSKRTRLLFSELRAKNCRIETFNAIRNREGSLSESQKECLLNWAQYCQDLYYGHDFENISHVPIENESLDSLMEFSEFMVAVTSLKRDKAPGKDCITNEDIKLLLPQESGDFEFETFSEMALTMVFNVIDVIFHRT